MKWRPIDEARMLAKVLSREFRKPRRNNRVIDDLIDQIKTLIPPEQGALVKTKRGWRVKLWSGSPRDRRPEDAPPAKKRRKEAA